MISIWTFPKHLTVCRKHNSTIKVQESNICESEHEHPRIDMQGEGWKWHTVKIKESIGLSEHYSKNIVRQIVNISMKTTYYIFCRKGYSKVLGLEHESLPLIVLKEVLLFSASVMFN